jgi:hypothetical protein
MVRHIVIWDLDENLNLEQKKDNALKIKNELENLNGIIEGLKSLKVEIDLLPSSNCDIALNSLFESAEALANYQVHPEHKRMNDFIKSVTQNRRCVDYNE